MKIVIYSASFLDYTIQLANALSKNNQILLVIPINRLSIEQTKNINKKITLAMINKPKGRSLMSLWWCFKNIRLITKFNPDVIHSQYGDFWLAFSLLFLKKYSRVTTIHDVEPHPGENDLLTKIVLWLMRNLSDKIIVHGKSLKKSFIKKYNYHNVYSVMHGNFEIYKQIKNVSQKKNQILFFGRIWEYKGLKYLIEAEPIIRKSLNNFKIIIAGTGENIEKYKIMIKNKKSFTIMNRYIEHDEMIKLFESSALVVLPYIEASQSGVIPLAYRYKKPIIATKVGAIPEMVKDKVTGLLIEPRNTEVLAKSIVYLLKNQKIMKAMGKAGYKFSRNELSWDKIAAKTVKIYRD